MSKKISNKKQLAKLVELMEKDPNLARSLCSKPVAKHRWQQIAITLNNLGPPFRVGEKWLRVWIDMKAKVKKKLMQNQFDLQATNGSANPLYTLSPLESAVENLLQFNTKVNNPINVDCKLSDEEETSTSFTDSMVDDWKQQNSVRIENQNTNSVLEEEFKDIKAMTAKRLKGNNDYDWLSQQVAFDMKCLKSEELRRDTAWNIQTILREAILENRKIKDPPSTSSISTKF